MTTITPICTKNLTVPATNTDRSGKSLFEEGGLLRRAGQFATRTPLRRAILGCLTAIGAAFAEDPFVGSESGLSRTIDIVDHVKFECPLIAFLFVVMGPVQ